MTFISSRGYAFTERAGAITVDGPGQGRLIADGRIGSALAEFVEYKRGEFRAEEDTRLGRWRWPEKPDYVVYPEGDMVCITNELTGRGNVFGRQWYEDHKDGLLARDAPWVYAAAGAYFDAHPEPKPWHDAKPGEVWVITIGGEEIPALLVVVDGGPLFKTERFHFGPRSSEITAGRRIYPEPPPV